MIGQVKLLSIFVFIIALVTPSAVEAAPNQNRSGAHVWPRSAESLQQTSLSDLIAAALPRGNSFSWSALQGPSVHWLTEGIESRGSSVSIRNGVARVRAGGIKAMMLRQNWEELGWRVELFSTGNAKWGPQTITVGPGFEGKYTCFGTGFEGCEFPVTALQGKNLLLTRVCMAGSGPANIIAFNARALDGRRGTVLYHTDAGSGGTSNNVEIVLKSARKSCHSYQLQYG